MKDLSLTCFELTFVTDFKEPHKRMREGNLFCRAIICQGIEVAQKIAGAMVGENAITLPSNSATIKLAKVFEVQPCEKFPNIFSENDNETWARVLKNLAIPDREKVLFLYISRASGKTEKVGVFFAPRQLREMFPEGEFTCSLD